MFYLKEILFRFQYLSISFILVFFLCFNYKDLLLYLLTEVITSNNINDKSFGVNYFIYTHPSELFEVYLTSIFYFSWLILFPNLLWSLLDFLKSGLIKSEHKHLSKLLIYLSFLVYVSNLFCFFTLFPNFWIFFESFNNFSDPKTNLNFFLELRIQDYFLFLKNFLYIINACLFSFLCLCFLFYRFGLKNLLAWKKLFIFFNIVFATLLSPPDVYSQLIILLTLTFVFESIIFFYVLQFKISKFIKLLVRKHIKRN